MEPRRIEEGHTLVVKYGGNAMTDPELRRRVASALGGLARDGRRLVIVHGGGPFIGRALEAAGIVSRFVRGRRVTDLASIGPVEAALTQLGKRLAQEVGDAIGLTGRDAGLLRAAAEDPELGRVGVMHGVRADVLDRLLDAGLTPVVACLALDDRGEPLNVNADEVAAAVAGALAASLVLLTDVPGVMDDPGDAASLQRTLTREQVRVRLEDGRISGGMIPKVEASLDGLERGARSAIVADGRRPDRLEHVLDGTDGTRIVP